MAGPGPLWRNLDADTAYPRLAEAALVDRRMALRLMAASAALAAASACKPSPETIAAGDPDAQNSRGFVRTTLDQNGLGFGVIVETADGRPVKIEGDPDHPASLGRSNVAAQAALLTHYDPDRLKTPRIAGRPTGWGALPPLLAELRDKLVGSGGAGLHILLQPTASPTLERMVAELREQLPDLRLHEYRPVPLAWEIAPDLLGARAIVSFGQDFLGPGPAQVRNAAAFMEARRNALRREEPFHFTMIESVPSLTGARADARIPLDPVRALAFAEAVAAVLEGGSGPDAAVALADRLRGSGRRTRLLLGSTQPSAMRAAVDRIAAAIGAPVTEAPPQLVEDVGVEPIDTLVDALDAGEVPILAVLGGNPAFDAPEQYRFAQAMQRAAASFYLGGEMNETAALATHVIAAAPALSRWGDIRAFDGTVSLIQPVEPQQGFTEIEFLAVLAGQAPDGETLVRETHGLDPAAFAEARRGARLPQAPVVSPPYLLEPQESPHGSGDVTLLFRPDAMLWDGALARNAWVQELPDPITGLAWGNAATLAPATAQALGLSDGDLVEIALGDARLVAPVKRLPGQAPGTAALTLGHGRRLAGAVGSDLGANGYALFDGNWMRAGATLRPAGGRARLIEPNAPFGIEDEQAVRFVAPGEAVAQRPALEASFADPDYGGTKQWGMAIDLDACIGCNACTIACQAENNVPVVGPDEVARGRAMHWIRIDRYHAGPAENPVTAFQPVPCMHCETAPCEPVCPVEATTHSSEGLNEMTYPRCVGTRSCSNNCPYKVRRFNWFDYAHEPPGMPADARNPRVTLRDAGVMEKCTYCVQRIEAVRVGDSEGPPQTACQQACPTRAISFGDIADPGSAVTRAKASPRNYALLGGMNLKPRTSYLARIRGEAPDDG